MHESAWILEFKQEGDTQRMQVDRKGRMIERAEGVKLVKKW